MSTLPLVAAPEALAALPFRVPVGGDSDGLRHAARALFEEALSRHRLARLQGRISAREADRIEAEMPVRQLSPGYYRRAAYLIELAETLNLGVPFPPECFTYPDLVGLRAVKTAFAEFEREHPGCFRCGERQDNPNMLKCHACGQKLRGQN